MNDTNLVQRPVYLPEDLDEKLGQLAFDEETEENELIRQAVKKVSERGFQGRLNGKVRDDSAMVMRTVYFSREIDEHLGQLASDKERGENDLICQAVEEAVQTGEMAMATPME
jgi:predicted transcriptional regulator